MPEAPLRTFETFLRALVVTIMVAGLCFGLAVLRPGSAAVAHPAAAAPTQAGSAAPVARPAGSHASRSHSRDAWVRPARGPVTSRFGPRWGGFHPGIDIGARYGSAVHAITDGTVVSSGWIAGYGKTVRVRSDGMLFYYPHLSRIVVRRGRVHAGQILGRVGSTGFSTGPHLHVEIRVHGRPVNPAPILRRHGVNL